MNEYSSKKLIYGSSLFKIPRPELYVLYNGLAEWGNDLTLKLSDAYLDSKSCDFGAEALKEYDSEEFLEVKVKVININPQKHAAILEKSQTLKEYGLFIDAIRGYLDKGHTRDDSIEAAIRDCIDRDILKEFLEKHGSEVYSMIFQEFNMETALEVAESEGLAKGESIGLTKGLMEAAKNMKKEGFPKDVIARIVGLDAETVEKL